MVTGTIPWLANIAGNRVAIIVAHQDDEAIGFCSVLMRCPQAVVVHVTDGAPENPREWKGLKDRRSYALLRQHELAAALDSIGHRGQRISLALTDGSVIFHMAALRRQLARIFRRYAISVAFTHAFEGGHPDHDATALSVHCAAHRHARVVEAPFYRKDGSQTVWQQFKDKTASELQIDLDPSLREAKAKMLAAHASQGGACSQISLDREIFRLSPAYDFQRPPNGGELGRNYAELDLHAETWAEFASKVLSE